MSNATISDSADLQGEGESIHYALGDVGKPEDMGRCNNYDDNLVPVHHSKRGDYCFVLRSSGKFTFARILSCEDKGPKSMVTLVVDTKGCTKSIPSSQCAQKIRLMRSIDQKLSSSSLEPQGRRSCQSRRRSSDPLPPSFKTRRPGLGRQHQPMAHMSLSGDERKQWPASSLAKRHVSLHTNYQSSFNKETHHLTSTDSDGVPAGVDTDYRSCDVEAPARRSTTSCSRHHHSIRSSIMTHIPKNDGDTQTAPHISSDTEDNDDALPYGNHGTNPMRSTYCNRRHAGVNNVYCSGASNALFRKRMAFQPRRDPSIHSSIITDVPDNGSDTHITSPVSSDTEDDLPSDNKHCPKPSLATKEIECDSSKITISNSDINDNKEDESGSFSSNNEDSLRDTTLRNPGRKSRYSIKRVPSQPDERVDRLEFNEVDLLAAFQSIVSRTVASTTV